MLFKLIRKRKYIKSFFDVIVDGELESGKGVDYEEMGVDVGVGVFEVEFFGDFDEVGGGVFFGGVGGFVDFV